MMSPDLADIAALRSGWEASQHASIDSAFYGTPTNFSDDLEPGAVLRIEHDTDLTNYTVPSSLSMSRIVYTTQNVNGTILPASAYILWPYNMLPPNDTAGYSTVLWAHGTCGLFQPCAPSNHRSLQYHFMIPYLLAVQGMVVVAPDYGGHGVGSLPNGDRIPHAWAAAPAQSHDMAHALTATRAAFPQYLAANGPFVAMGHSEGGHAAWGYAERQAREPLLNCEYRGTVAFAPAADPTSQLEVVADCSETAWAFNIQQLQPMLIYAITAVYPSYNYSGWSEAVANILNYIYQPSGGCLRTQNVLFSGVPAEQLSRPGWTEADEVEQWQNLTAV